MHMIIILNGSAQSGKNTFVEYCRECTSKRIWHLSTIDSVKSFCYETMGIEFWIKSDEHRKIWHETKMKDKDYLFWDMCKTLEISTSNSHVFLDVREPEEIAQFVEHFEDITTLLIRRPNLDVPDNEADKFVENYPYDHIIDNNGSLAKLQKKAQIFMENL